MKAFCVVLMLVVPTGILCSSGSFQRENLRTIYAGKLDYEEGAGGQSWTSLPEDVWRVDSFSYSLKNKLQIELGPCVVVFGKHEDDRGRKSVVWATVIPNEGAAGEPIVASTAGHGSHVKSIFMRFHPSLVGKLFPKKTVLGHGEPIFSLWGKRIYAHKINGHWQAENMPVVPWKQSLVFDVETVEGRRRCFMVDSKKQQVEYVEPFADRTIPDPPSEPIESSLALELFDKTWESFDREYAMFSVKPNVDWAYLRELYRPIAGTVQTTYELAGVVSLMLSQLEDLHIWVKADESWLPGFNRMRPLNASWNVVKADVRGLNETGHGVDWGTTSDGFGYIAVWNLSSSGLVDAFDDALEGLGSTRGLILDLRFNGGGDENLGRAIAGRFASEELVYSISRYRNGERHEDLGPELPRKFEPRGPWRYESTVVVLIGQRTMSSAESLALMLAGCPEVTTMGDRTAGSSGNPRQVEIGEGIVVNLPTWLDLDPEGRPIDAVGVSPMKSIEVKLNSEGDPVFAAAVSFLKKKKSSKAGRR